MSQFIRCVGGRLININHIAWIDASESHIGAPAIVAYMQSGAPITIESFDGPSADAWVAADHRLAWWADQLQALDRLTRETDAR